MATTYFWRGKRNFGDWLALPLLTHFTQMKWTPVSPEEAQVVAVGSIAEHLPEKYSGVVAGIGKLHRDSMIDLSHATVLGLRGHLTRRILGVKGHIVVADPGLLASELVPVERDKYELGVVPHWTDEKLFPSELAKSRRYRYAEPRLIESIGDPLEILKEIGSCKKIVASSLHGLIAADSFGIPRRAEMFEKMTRPHEGGTYKFEDYGSAIQQPVEFGTLQTAPRLRVELAQAELFDMFREIPYVLP